MGNCSRGIGNNFTSAAILVHLVSSYSVTWFGLFVHLNHLEPPYKGYMPFLQWCPS